MVKRQKQKISSKKKTAAQMLRRSVLVVTACATVIGVPAAVYADQFEEKIQQLQTQVASDQQSAGALQNQANDLTTQILALQSQIALTQAQIDSNQAQFDDLSRQIDEAQKELARQKSVLGDNIREMYIEGDMSTVEMLASSKNISEYLDKQQYRDSVKDKISDTMVKIDQLKKELNTKRDQVTQLLNDQKKLKGELAGKQGQLSGMLAATNANKDEINRGIDAKRDEIIKLRAQQAAANRAHGGVANYVPGAGGYPAQWANAPKDSMVDNWGMYNRECVSYTAWYVSSTGRDMPHWGGRGNANQWPGNARAAGIAVDSNPKAGDIAIGYWGPYGHAMVVKQVMGNGQIYVAQYNYEVQGLYSEMVMSTSGLEFIHF